MPSCHTYLRALRALRAHVSYVLCAFVPLLCICLHFFTCLTCLQLFSCLKCSHFLLVLRASIFYVPYAPSFFTSSTCHHFLRVFIFLRAYNLFMYMLIKLTQINELTYDFSSFLLLNSVIYQCSSIIFTSIKLVSYSA